MNKLTLILRYNKLARTALSVVAGALDTDPLTRTPGLRIATDADALAAVVRGARADGERVLVAWSFYSPQFPEAVTELRRVREIAEDQGVLHIAGGPHATAEPAQTLAASFDLVPMAEGEQIIVDLCRAPMRSEPLDGIRALPQRLAKLGARIHSHTFMPLPGPPFPEFARGTCGCLDPAATGGTHRAR